MARLSLTAHGALELLAGVVLIAAAFVLDLGATGLIAALAAGVLLAGLGLNDQMPIRTHYAADTVLAAALLAGSVALAAAEHNLAAGVLAATAAAELTLTATTRWTRA
jgi:hypothetical protein